MSKPENCCGICDHFRKLPDGNGVCYVDNRQMQETSDCQIPHQLRKEYEIELAKSKVLT